jgi:hypothetical protein
VYTGNNPLENTKYVPSRAHTPCCCWVSGVVPHSGSSSKACPSMRLYVCTYVCQTRHGSIPRTHGTTAETGAAIAALDPTAQTDEAGRSTNILGRFSD